MIISSKIHNLYNDTYALVEEVGRRVSDVVSAYCLSKDHLFDARIKSVESVAEKIETGRYSRWTEIDDLYACTVVISLASLENETLEFLKASFEEVVVRTRGTSKRPPDAFRFDSTRFIGRLRRPPGMEDAAMSIYQIPFEVQIKTVFEYAWAKATHALVYKSAGVDWRKMHLAAQLKAAVETLDLLTLGFGETAGLVGLGCWPAVEDKLAIEQFFTEKVEQGLIPKELTPKDWSRFSDNLYRALSAFEDRNPTWLGNRNLDKLSGYLERIDTEIRNLGPDKIPRSLSLFQFVIGILISEGASWKKFRGYCLPITDEMLAVFPHLMANGSVFAA